MDEIASESILEQAYAWLCERRQDNSPNDDVWDVRWRWEEIRRSYKPSCVQAAIVSARFGGSAKVTKPSRSGQPWMPWC